VSPLRGEKPQNWPLSKLNTGRFALRAMLPVMTLNDGARHSWFEHWFGAGTDKAFYEYKTSSDDRSAPSSRSRFLCKKASLSHGTPSPGHQESPNGIVGINGGSYLKQWQSPRPEGPEAGEWESAVISLSVVCGEACPAAEVDFCVY